MDIIVIYCTVPNKKMAKEITNVLMKHKLAACVSMIENVQSVFSWDGEVVKEKEILMMIKTRRANYGKIKLVIEDLHDYNVPEIIALPIVDCSEDYLKWLVKETNS
ncbi:MAG: divalent-cation tolerance protein CutA [bacterium]|nr:divalent-cation tolerance protein CutA [bacterium]